LAQIQLPLTSVIGVKQCHKYIYNYINIKTIPQITIFIGGLFFLIHMTFFASALSPFSSGLGLG
jgi:hypothetical protein